MVPNFMARYQVIEKDWRLSNARSDLLKRYRYRLINVEHKIINCACFGTGTFRGLRRGEAFPENKENDIKKDAGPKVALYLFKSVVDGIETMQCKRPVSFAQELTYNRFDFEFLKALNITVKDVNSGFEFVHTRSRVYLPVTECCVAIEVKKLDPDILLLTGAFNTVTGRDNKDWTTCGFTSGLEHGHLKGSGAGLRIKDEFRNSRDWQIPTHLASSRLKGHETAYQNPMLAIRKESVVGEERVWASQRLRRPLH